jgi:uncharacterized protein YneF (UPF0154 family)
MLTWIIFFSLTSIIAFIATGYFIAKKHDPLIAVSLIISVATFLCAAAFEKAFCYRKEMQRRLNQPVSSVVQLYGYKILDKRYTAEKPSSEALVKTNYFVDLEDLIPPQRGILKNVELLEKVYNDERVEKGASFFPDDPNE